MWVHTQTENQLSPVKVLVPLTSPTVTSFYIRKEGMSYFSSPILAPFTGLVLQAAAPKIRFFLNELHL